MIIAVDTNVLLDVLSANVELSLTSREKLQVAGVASAFIICPIVYSEVASQFTHPNAVDRFLAEHNISLDRSDTMTLHTAGLAWRTYARRRSAGLMCPSCGAVTGGSCRKCGGVLGSRQHVVADFLIGAHALLQADALLTRDLGYYGTYFPDLVLA